LRNTDGGGEDSQRKPGNRSEQRFIHFVGSLRDIWNDVAR
jgi:hypothetical protein